MSDPVTYVILGLEAKDWLETETGYIQTVRYNEKTGEPYTVGVPASEHRVGGKVVEFPEGWEPERYTEEAPVHLHVVELLGLEDYPRDPSVFAHQMNGIIGVRLARVDAYDGLAVVDKEEFHRLLDLAREGLKKLGIEKEPNTIVTMRW